LALDETSPRVPGQHVVSKVLLKQFAVPTNGGKQLLEHSPQYGKARLRDDATGHALGVLGGVPFADASTVILPLGPRRLAALGRTDTFRSVPEAFVKQLNAFQIAKAQTYVFVRPGSGLGPADPVSTIVHPFWSGSMPVLVEGAAEPVPSADVEVRDPLGIGHRFG
jgi:hypothetical protein